MTNLSEPKPICVDLSANLYLGMTVADLRRYVGVLDDLSVPDSAQVQTYEDENDVTVGFMVEAQVE